MAEALEDVRRFYARYICALGGADDPRIVDAFASVPRERFLGPGPWLLMAGSAYVETPSDDPAYILNDAVVGLIPEKHVNNGQPSLHARCFASLAPWQAKRAAHVGAGSGYYTAILATIVGPESRIDAFEIEPMLAARALENLASYRGVHLHASSGVEAELRDLDILYASAGVTDIDPRWLDALAEGGRLLVPLTPADGFGGMLHVQRLAANRFAARFLARVSFVPCLGASGGERGAKLARLFEPRTFDVVRSLHRGEAQGAAWYQGDGWWLSTSDA